MVKINKLGLTDYVVLDTEYLVYSHEIYQIGLIRIKNGMFSGSDDDIIDLIVNPGKPKAPKDFDLNDITNEQLEKSEPIECSIDRIINFIGNSIIVGYNVKTSDIDKINEAYYAKHQKKIDNDYVDVMDLVIESNLKFNNNNCSLEKVVDHFGLIGGNHYAYEDCINTYRVYEILKYIPKQSVSVKKKKKSNSYHLNKEVFIEELENVNVDKIITSDLSSIKFCFTKCRPDEGLLMKMKALGVSGDCFYERLTKKDNIDYVVAKDENTTSNKTADACNFKVKIITYSDFVKLFDEEYKRYFSSES